MDLNKKNRLIKVGFMLSYIAWIIICSKKNSDNIFPKLLARSSSQISKPSASLKNSFISSASNSSASQNFLKWSKPSNASSGVKRNPSCVLPPGGFRGWKDKVVTVIKPEIKKNCSKIFSGDKFETHRISKLMVNLEEEHSQIRYLQKGNRQLIKKSSDCNWLTKYMTNNMYNTHLELSFPVAYSVLVQDNFQQFFRLFRILYRPQNVYCVHPYKKTASLIRFLSNLANCFNNIMVTKQLVDENWSDYTSLDAQMQCLSHLMDYQETRKEVHQWRYVINLSGEGIPLLSNKEIVKKLIALNGTSSVKARSVSKSESNAILRQVHKPLWYNWTFYRSTIYNALSESFVLFLVKNSIAQNLYEALREAETPEVLLYATLFHMPACPGGYNPEIDKEIYFEVSHRDWISEKYGKGIPCYGRFRDGKCMVNHAHLPHVLKETKNASSALFYSTYMMEVNNVATDCMEERIVDMNKLEYDMDCA